MSATRLNISLANFEIGISGAVSGRDSWSEPAMDRAVLEFVALFSGIVFKYGGRIVHGSHPTFTPVILRQARQHFNSGGKKPVTLIMSNLWAKALPKDFKESVSDVADLVVTEQVGEGGPENTQTRNQSLTAMREVLIGSQNIMVAVGGKLHAKDGIVPGLWEEMEIAGKKGIPRFLIGGMGGFAAKYAKEIIPASLNNGLSDDENVMLFSTSDVSACVNVIFDKLANLKS